MTPTTQAGVYAILDLLAKEILGGLQLFKHPAPAIRFFSDVASQQGSIVNSHPEDFSLICLGYVNERNEIVPNHTTVIDGKTWKAAQLPKDSA